MATHALSSEILEAHRRVSLRDRRRIAIAAHHEVPLVLRDSSDLRRLGMDDVLIGSYSRGVAIWPGNDVDAFGRLMNCSTSYTAGSAPRTSHQPESRSRQLKLPTKTPWCSPIALNRA